MMTAYIDQFLHLRCAPDVLGIVGKIAEPSKEISEAMTIISRLRDPVLGKKMYYTVVDLCAGNTLTGLLIAHLLPVKQVIAVDKKRNDRQWFRANRFTYVQADIYNEPTWLPNEPTILVSSHPCKLATRIVEIYNQHDSCMGLVMIPCCKGTLKLPQFLIGKLGKYLAWCYQLATDVGGKVEVDKQCLSPCNGVVVALKKEVEHGNKT